MMNILYLNPVGKIGGAERVLLHLMSNTRTIFPSAKITLLCLTDGPLLEATRQLGIPVVVCSIPAQLSQMGESQLREKSNFYRSVPKLLKQGVIASPSAVSFLRRFRSLCLQLRPDLIHSNGIKTHFLSRWLSPQIEAKQIWHIHDFCSLRPISKWLLYHHSRRISAFMAISDAVAKDTISICSGKNIYRLYNTTDTKLFSPGPSPNGLLDSLAGMPHTTEKVVRFGLVATYARWKGHEIFLRAAQKLCVQYPDLSVRFYIIGGPIYDTSAQYSKLELNQLIQKMGLQQKVGLIPFQKDTIPIYRALDVVVHASTLPEPFGLTITEAMSCGCAVIVSQAGGAAEIFTHELDALGYPLGDIDTLSHAMYRLASDPALRNHLGKNARSTVQTKFDTSCIIEPLSKYYREVLEIC